ncbi:Uncharacterised protein r2_g3578 [Pycnogonum litorale]
MAIGHTCELSPNRFHHSHNAIRRWCITSTLRGMSVTELRNMTGLETVEQPATQLRATRIEKDSRHRDALINAITESCDPFSSSSSAFLLNVSHIFFLLQ